MNVRKDKLTPRIKGWLDQAMDLLDKERTTGKRDIVAKFADQMFADPMKFAADIERREQAAGAPAAALGGPSVSVQSLYLQALQMQPGDGARLIEAKPE